MRTRGLGTGTCRARNCCGKRVDEFRGSFGSRGVAGRDALARSLSSHLPQLTSILSRVAPTIEDTEYNHFACDHSIIDSIREPFREEPVKTEMERVNASVNF